jgi:RNA polymerase sigma-70 factor (ECF subfamily)
MQLHQLRNPERAKPWLFTILRNGYLHRIRSEKSRHSVSLEAITDPPAPECTAAEVGTDELQQALNELPEPFRAPIILFYFEEFSYRDIAEQLDVPIGTVMSRLARAKSHLRMQLAPTTAGDAAHGL